MNTNIQNIILNFFNNDCNLVELKTLLDFIVIEENYIQFNEYVCINYLSNLSMNQFDKTSIIKDLESRIKKQEKQRQTILSFLGVLMVMVVVLFIKYGFTNVKDTVLRNPSKLLLEKTDWVKSEYGAPGITLSTPNVLERQTIEGSEKAKENVRVVRFAYTGKDAPIDVFVISSKYAPQKGQDGKEKEVPIDVLESTEAVLDRFEKEGSKNIFSRNEQFITPNGQEGVKTYGTAEFIINEKLTKGEYVVLGFSTPNLLQQVILVWKEGDVYADQIIERILSSIELITLTEDQK